MPIKKGSKRGKYTPTPKTIKVEKGGIVRNRGKKDRSYKTLSDSLRSARRHGVNQIYFKGRPLDVSKVKRVKIEGRAAYQIKGAKAGKADVSITRTTTQVVITSEEKLAKVSTSRIIFTEQLGQWKADRDINRIFTQARRKGSAVIYINNVPLTPDDFIKIGTSWYIKDINQLNLPQIEGKVKGRISYEYQETYRVSQQKQIKTEIEGELKQKLFGEIKTDIQLAGQQTSVVIKIYSSNALINIKDAQRKNETFVATSFNVIRKGNALTIELNDGKNVSNEDAAKYKITDEFLIINFAGLSPNGKPNYIVTFHSADAEFSSVGELTGSP